MMVPNIQGKGAMGLAQQKRRAVLLVEDDAELRGLTAKLLDEGEFDTIECESAEAGLATMLIRGRDIAMIFADIKLPGVMDGIDLACEVKMRWPLLPVILTSGLERVRDLPLGVDYIAKPAAQSPLNKHWRLSSSDKLGSGNCTYIPPGLC
jgi:DNA-binding response OmpR family regulator